MYETVNLVVVWRKYKENPHIEYNSNTRMYRCKTCNVLLNNNPGGAGKHSTKLHGFMLSGKKFVEKKKSVSVPDFSNKDIFEGVVDISEKFDENFRTILSHLEVLNNKNHLIEGQHYLLMEKIHEIESKQEYLLKTFDNLKKENTKVIDFVKYYLILKAANQRN